MAMLEGKLSLDDIELLIDSMGYWESAGNQDFHMMQMVKNAVLPDEDDDSFEFVKRVKEHFSGREKEIKADRSLRQEKATMLKAKLMLMRSDMGVDWLFEEAGAATTDAEQIEKPVKVPVKSENGPKKPVVVKSEKKVVGTDPEKLAKAEQFLEQAGITTYYEGFLNGEQSTLEKALQYIEECGMKSHFEEFLSS